MFYSRITTRFGPMLLTANEMGLTGAYFEGQKYFPELTAHDLLMPAFRVLDQAALQLAEFERGERAEFDLPLAPEGTVFQLAVWRALTNIKAGALSQYGRIAQEVGAPAAARAVGAAVGRNPLSVIIPCHRVIGASGALTGYAGGVERKRALLVFEAETFNA
jgi:methylated-DNA-[protein]-cysteine S-methyltransferase